MATWASASGMSGSAPRPCGGEAGAWAAPRPCGAAGGAPRPCADTTMPAHAAVIRRAEPSRSRVITILRESSSPIALVLHQLVEHPLIVAHQERSIGIVLQPQRHAGGTHVG